DFRRRPVGRDRPDAPPGLRGLIRPLRPPAGPFGGANPGPRSTVLLAVGLTRRRLHSVDRARTSPDLMAAFARRDPGPASELDARFAPRIFGLGMVMLGNSSQAEDLVQDTFVKVWRNAPSYDPGRGS